MIEHTFLQGSEAWHAHRATARNASDAAVIMGCHPTRTRDEWLHERHTGMAKEHSQFVQEKVFAPGHAIEAAMRPVAEGIIGEDLGSVVGSETVEGIVLSASFDGLTMMGDAAWECKTLNSQLVAVMPHAGIDGVTYNFADRILVHYQIQMQQQCMVSGCARILFTASDGKGDNRHCWYYPNAELGKAIIAAWKQADIDAAAYVPPAATAPAPTGRAPETLPALFISVKGEVTDSNLANFKEVALTAIRSVNRELSTDQDFADAEKAVKWCSDIEERVAGAKQNALSQTASIDALFKTMDDISAEARQVRLDLDKLIKARKLSLKSELLVEVQNQLIEHRRGLNARIGRDYLPQMPVDFAAAIHGKKNFDSMRSALNAALANAKIEANAVADRISANMATLTELASAHKFLFGDASTIVLKANDDLTALVKTRIADHKDWELAEEKAKEETMRLRIQAEEQAKAEAAARAKVLAEQEAERAEAQRMSAIQAQAEKVAAEFAAQQNAPQIIQEIISVAPAVEFIAVPAIQTVAPAANVVPLRASQPVPATQAAPLMKLGQIAERLGFTLTADFLESLGYKPAAMQGASKLYHHDQFGFMCEDLVKHIRMAQAKQAA